MGIKLSDSGAQLQFRDGTSEEFDLVVGADGIKSRTRQLLFGTSTPQSSSIRIQFGVCPPGAGPRPQDQRQELHQWFGDGAYCLVYTGGGSDSPQDMVALVRQEASAVSSENAGWETSEVKQDCIARLREGRFPKEVEAVAESCERFMDIGVFYPHPAILVQGRARCAFGRCCACDATLPGPGSKPGHPGCFLSGRQASGGRDNFRQHG